MKNIKTPPPLTTKTQNRVNVIREINNKKMETTNQREIIVFGNHGIYLSMVLLKIENNK
jgi:hypothetical protein